MVAISPLILQEEGGAELLQNIKKTFNLASGRLFEITERRAYFKEITFLIPSSWQPKAQWLPQGESVDSANKEKYKDAIIYVEKDGAFGKSPYAIQTDGCGQQGLRIHLPEKFFKSADHEERANKFIYEWSKYKYGVFNEHGFENDERYPRFYGIPGTSEVEITSCLDKDITFKNDSCLPNINPNSGRLDINCHPEIQTIENRHSSFMYSSQLKYFCGMNEFVHNSRSPTKHNALCKEKSVWDIISQHEDFKDGRNSESAVNGIPRTTIFRYAQLRDVPLRMVIAIDKSKEVTPQRKQIFKHAITRFIKLSVPEKSLVGFVHFSDASEHIYKEELKKINEIQVVKSYQNSNTSPCLSCALLESVDLLQKESVSDGGIIILLTTAELNKEDITNLTEIVTSSKVTVHIIKLYLNSDLIPEEQLNIISKTGGSIQEIPENSSKSNEHKSFDLYLALCRTIQDEIFGTINNQVVITQNIFTGPIINITFPIDAIDSRISRDLLFLFTTVNYEELDEKSMNLSSNEIYYDRQKFQYVLDNDRYIIISSPKAGWYRFVVQKKPSYPEPVFISVSAKVNKYLKSITVRCWLNTDNQMVNPITKPVKIYAEVYFGNQPVRNARVKATLIHPNSDITTIMLIDDGIGDPDITKDDGIYSRYLVEFSKHGRYYLIVSVDDNNGKAEVSKMNIDNDGQCCGSFVPGVSVSSTGSFQRIFNFGNFYVLNVSTMDIYPPSRILDLKVINITTKFEDDDSENWNVDFFFNFTSVGDNYNIGNASNYEIKYFDNRNEVRDFSNRGKKLDSWAYHPKLEKLEYGTPQVLKIEIPLRDIRNNQKNVIIYFAMRATDESDNKGEVSNTVETVISIPDIPTTSPVTTETVIENELDHNKMNKFKDNDSKPSALKIGMIAGICCGVLIIIIIIIATIILVRRRKREPPKKGHKIKKNEIKRVSNEYLDNIAKKDSDLTMNHLSPIQSWPANVLMNHYDKVKEAKQNNMAAPIMKLEDVLESSSMGSSKSLQSNVIYEGGFERGNNYSFQAPTAPLSSSTSSLNHSSRHITQV